MSKHDETVRLRHMHAHSCEAAELMKGKSREDLDRDRTLQLALTRLIEIIGEAAARVSKEAQQQYPDVAWSAIISTRNRLIHGYDFVDFDILWDTVTEDLPLLIGQLETILGEVDG